MIPDYYHQLGIRQDATKDEIKKAYRKLALEWHPDRNKNSGSHEKFIEINEAYLILFDDEARAKYDTEHIKHFKYEEPSSYNESDRFGAYDQQDSFFDEEHTTYFDDDDLNDWSKKAKSQGNEYAQMSFDKFSDLVKGFIKETGFQLGNSIVVFFGILLTMGGCGNLIIGLTSKGEIGNPIIGIVILPIGILLFRYANRNWDNHRS